MKLKKKPFKPNFSSNFDLKLNCIKVIPINLIWLKMIVLTQNGLKLIFTLVNMVWLVLTRRTWFWLKMTVLTWDGSKLIFYPGRHGLTCIDLVNLVLIWKWKLIREKYILKFWKFSFFFMNKNRNKITYKKIIRKF
jgi:hypothetical protein